MAYLLIIIGFAFLIKGADLLVAGGSAFAGRFGISDLVIGLTVVAFGTSMPELFVNLFASFNGNTDIAVGNILGSNIANIFLILGVSALVFPLSVTPGTVWKEIPLSFLAAIVLWILANDRLIDGASASMLTRTDGLILLCFFIIFLYYSAGIAKAVNGMNSHVAAKEYGLFKSLLFIIAGLAGLTIGGKWIVDGAVRIARDFALSESFIGLTIVALGTSLPELATSAVAAYRKNAEIAVGNVIGSNIFNIFFILGISSAIRPLPFQGANNIDIGMVVLSSALLFIFMFSGKKRSLDRWEAALFLMLYAGYISFLVVRP